MDLKSGSENDVNHEASFPSNVFRQNRTEESSGYKLSSTGDVIHAEVNGFWSLGDVANYLRHLSRMIATMRSEYRRARVIVDARQLPVQSADVIKTFKAANDLFLEGDRVAIIVASSLLKMQLSRSIEGYETKVFISIDAAKTWLNAYP